MFRCYKVSGAVTLLNIIISLLGYLAVLYLTIPPDLLHPINVFVVWLLAAANAKLSILITIRSLCSSNCFPAVPVYTHEDQRLSYMKDGVLLDDDEGLVMSMNVRRGGAEMSLNYNLPRL